ncbi:MAG: efflux RND transporter periplasmic adaptor subunit, partial [Alphaproteobacteria bacterium]|nr:efflux RND transporter periplasmic adaptor subunit [Alphaproteobacteria bacterium]
MKKKWKALLFLFVVLIGAGVWLGYDYIFPRSKQSPSLTLYTVATGDIEQLVTAQGKLEPKDSVAVGAQVSGQIKTLLVDFGDVVKAGALIAEIDPELYESEVQVIEARLKTLRAQKMQQEAQATQAKQKWERNRTLYNARAVSQEVYQDSQTSLKIAEAQLTALQAQIEEAQSTLEGAKANLNYTKIYAPMSGTVVNVATKEGETLNANQTTPTIIEVADLDTMTVRAQVAEADVTRLKIDMPVYFTTLGSQERRWNGTVRQILPSPEEINDVVLYNVLVDVDNTDRQLMTGMTTQMFFVTGHAEKVP